MSDTTSRKATPETTLYRDCIECSQRFPIYHGEQEYAEENPGYILPKRCHKCREKRRSKAKDVICKTCGKGFTISAGELKFFADNNLSEPRRCPVCRKNKDRK